MPAARKATLRVPEDRWTRLHRLLRGRPHFLWRILPAPSPFPPPFADSWRAARALAMAVRPLAEGRILTATRQGDGFAIAAADPVSSHVRIALETAARPALARLARIDGEHRPVRVRLRQPNAGEGDHLFVEVHLAGLSGRMGTILTADGEARRPHWTDP